MRPAANLSVNLAPGVALGQAVAALQDIEREIGMPTSVNGTFQGSAQAFQSSLASQPFLILAALVAVYIILGVLYESLVHPLTRSEEHTSELQSLMRNSYAVFCLKKKTATLMTKRRPIYCDIM